MTDYGIFFKKRYIISNSKKHLFLTILPTEKCNFRCEYCYEDFQQGKMNGQVVKNIKTLITNHSLYVKNLYISWFGGEPTLNSKAIIDISTHTKKVCDINEIKYSSGMTTNGYLLDKNLFDKFCSLGIREYQISLDGEHVQHDSTRKLISGRGTFDKIWRNLESFKESKHEFDVILRIHITNKNIESIRKLTKLIKNNLLIDSRFSVSIEKIKNLGKGLHNGGEYLSVENIDEIQGEILSEIGPSVNKRFSAIDKFNPYICYASMPQHFLIRSNGDIGKCTVNLNSSENKLGYLSNTGEIILDEVKEKKWCRGMVSMDPSELSCPSINIEKA